MPTFDAKSLKNFGANLLVAAGASPEEAGTVAKYCVNANLVGHDSHGIMLILNYVQRIKAGHIQPGAPWEIVQESPTTTVVDGNWGFGFVVTEQAMKYTIKKAKTANVAAATVFRQSHIGRLATYPLMAIEEGMIGLITADSGRSPKTVAPFGGREARLGTNPISIAVPSNLESPLYLDMATSAVSNGKVAVSAARNENIPEGWIIDSNGNHSTDPNKLKSGALLPLGGATVGYKGTGLGAMVEILCGLLTGLGFGVEPSGFHNDGCFLAVFNVEAFRPLEDFKQEVADFAAYLNDTPPMEGSSGVLYPGEIEKLSEVERREGGIPIEGATWEQLTELANELGVNSNIG